MKTKTNNAEASFFSAIFHSTFGGNPLASAVAIASLEVIKNEKLVERYQMLCKLILSMYTCYNTDLNKKY